MAEAPATKPAPAPKQVGRRLGEVGGRTLVILAVIAASIAALVRLDLRLDWSADSRFSIQPALADIVAGLEQPVEVVAIWTPEGSVDAYGNPDPRRDELVAFLSARLRQIAELDPELSLREIDQVVDQPALEAFKAAHGEALPGSIYLIGNGRPFRLPVTEVLRYTLQRDLGGALVTVSARERLPIYVLQGHGELPWQSRGSDGIGHLLHRLSLAGMDFDPARHALDPAALSRLGRIPDDGVLLIPGPTGALGTEAVAAVEAYLRDGGPALILADHRCPQDLALLLRRWGLLVAEGFPVAGDIAADQGQPPGLVRSLDRSMRGADRDFTRLLIGPENLGQIRPDEFHPAVVQTAGSERRVISPETTPVQAVPWHQELTRMGDEAPAELASWVAAEAGAPMAEISWLAAMAAEDAWVSAPEDRTPPAGATNGPPIMLGFAVTYAPHAESANPDRGSRVAIWGSRGLAVDRWVADPQYVNDLLLTDVVSWLADRGASTPIAIQQFASYQVTADDGTMNLLMALLVAFIPCLCIGAAMLSWWERR